REPSARILVADDNADMRDYLVRLLRDRWEVEAVLDGNDALAAAQQRPPDLILSDVMMPGLDGIGLLRRLRAEPATSTIPVILLSARAGEEMVLEGLETGADDYLVKPFSARELLARVRTHLEMARLRRRWTARLEQAYRELESFSYSVSHDLRAPLRAIDGFSQALLQDYGAGLDDTAQDHLRRVRTAAQRMGLLIDDILKLSRVGRAELRRERVDLSLLARTIAAELARHDPERRVLISVQDELTVEADPRLLRVAMENLLGNAWKFTGKQPQPMIDFRAARNGTETVYALKDNGAGFDMQYAKKLFGAFQRLHTEEEFPGTGIGLATVQRIISRHGGRVWATGEVDRGATFFFTLPPAEMI
ncbi:MAG: response regulator, partial [Nitrospirota bacterium]